MNKIRILLIVVVIYLIGHLVYIYFTDLSWMPPTPPSNPDPASARKKSPDGPLILREDFFDSVSGIVKNGQSRGLLSKVIGNIEDTILVDVKYGVKRIDEAKLKKLKLSEAFAKTFKRAAKLIEKRTNGFVLFTLINKAYLNITLNWLCNIYALQNSNEEIHKSVLIVSLEEGSCLKINKEWKNVTCLSFKGVDSRFNQPLEWGRRTFSKLMSFRINLIAVLAEAKIPFVVFETDQIWFKNPMQRLFSNSDLVEDADLVLPLNWRNEKGKNRFASVPMVAFPTNATRRAAQEMRRIVNRGPEYEADQDSLLNKLCSTQYMGLVCREFVWELLADGHWLKMSDSERKSRTKTAPYIVHNNFYSGVRNKVARQTINSLWFLSPSNVCNLSKARKILAKYV